MSCALPFTAVAIALKSAFTSSALAGVSGVKVLGMSSVPPNAAQPIPARIRAFAAATIRLVMVMPPQLQSPLSHCPVFQFIDWGVGGGAAPELLDLLWQALSSTPIAARADMGEILLRDAGRHLSEFSNFIFNLLHNLLLYYLKNN
jgi:hypothetical protein